MERQTVAKAQKSAPRSHPLQRQSAGPSSAGHPLLELQRSIGNQAVQRLLRSPYIQTRLQVSTPGDPFEQEADRVADAVMRMTEPEPEATEEETPQIQTKSLATQITPLVQRESEQPLEEEKEEAIAMEPVVQRVPLAVREDDDEEKVAPKLDTNPRPQEEEEKTVATKLARDAPLQRQAREDEEQKEETLQTAPLIQTQMEEEQEEVQTKPLSGSLSQIPQIYPVSTTSSSLSVQRLCAECEDELAQPKPLDNKLIAVTQPQVHRKEGPAAAPQVAPSVSANIRALQGGGSPLPPATRGFFEPRFGADFEQVRVHTDGRAEETAKSLNARAFTVGRSIAFGAGQYSPDTLEGRRLLAHELTHVVQQNGSQLPRSQLLTTAPSPQAATVNAQASTYGGEIDFNESRNDTNSEVGQIQPAPKPTYTIQEEKVHRKAIYPALVKTSSDSDTIQRLTQAEQLTRGEEVYDLLDGWTSSADSAEILNKFKGLSQRDVNAIINVTALHASLSVFDVYKWLHDDMVSSDWKSLMKMFVTVNSVDLSEVIAYVVVNDFLEGWTSDEDSKEILEYLSGVPGTQLDVVLTAMETKAEKKFPEMVTYLFGEMQDTDAQALSISFFGSGSLKAIDYGVYWHANKIKDLLAGYTGIRDSRSILQNFQRIGGKGEKADTASQVAVLTKLNELTFKEWGKTAEQALMEDLQQEDYNALQKMLPKNLAVYSIEKNFLSRAWDKIVSGYDYVEGFIEYIVCGIFGILVGIFDAVVSIISGIIDIGFAIKNIIGWLISKASGGRFARESEENVNNFFSSLGKALGAPLDLMGRMWNATKEEASLIEGPFEECKLAIFWVRKVANFIINILLIIFAGYGAVKAAIEALEAVKQISGFAELLSKLGKLPVAILRKIKSIPASLATGGRAIIGAIRNVDSIAAAVRKTIGLIRLAARDPEFFLNLRKASGEFIESKMQAEKEWWGKRKEIWNSSATTEEAKIAKSEELVNTATTEAETNPAAAEQKALQAENQALDAQNKTNNAEKEIKSGQTAEDRAAEQPPGVKSPEFKAWEKGLNPETRALLEADPELRKFWQDMDPDVRRALTYCNTPCIPLNAHEWPEVIAQIKNLQQRLKLPAEHRGLREYLHIYRNDRQELSKAIKALDLVNSLKEFEAFLDNQLIKLIKETHGVTIRKGTDGLWEYPRTDGTVVREFEIGTHSNLTSSRGTDSFFQSHHGIQDAWAKERLNGLGVYDREQAKTLLLRSRNLEGGSRGTPHGLISDLQKARPVAIKDRTFAQELSELAKDLDVIAAPVNVKTQYLAEVEQYFKGLYDVLASRLSKDELTKIFGDWPK